MRYAINNSGVIKTLLVEINGVQDTVDIMPKSKLPVEDSWVIVSTDVQLVGDIDEPQSTEGE